MPAPENVCARCGAEPAVVTRFVAVVSESCWVCSRNFPTPCGPTWREDHFRFWEVGIGRACLERAWRRRLERRLDRSRGRLSRAVLVLAAGTAGWIALVAAAPDATWSAGLRVVSELVVVLAAILALVSAAHFFALRGRSAQPTSVTALDTEALTDLVLDETQLALDELEAGRKDALYGNFDMPTFDARAADLEADLGKCERTHRSRKAVAAATTVEVLEARLAATHPALTRSRKGLPEG